MDQNDDEPPPFWLQTTTTFNHLNHHRHRRRNHRNPASVFLNTGVLVTFLLVAAILFMFILVPYVLSLARQVFNPKLVKSSWSSLNIVLVLFAILCGFLGRREDDQNTPVNTPKTAKSGLYGDPDRVGFTGLRRNSSSYPDLRQESSKWRFYDDTDVEILHLRRSDSGFSQPRSFKKSDGSDEGGGESGDGNNFVEIKNVEVNDKNDVVDDESKSDSPSPSVVDEDENVDEDDEVFEISTNVEEIVNNEIEDESSSKNVEVGSFDSVDETKIESSQEFQPSQTPPESPLMKLFPPPSPTSYFWPSPSPPPPPPPPPPTRRAQAKVLPKEEANQTFETIGYGRYKWNNNTNTKSNAELPVPPQSSTSTPKPRSKPVVVAHYSESKQQQSSERKKGGVAVTKDFFTSFYNQSKKKRKHKRRSYENLEEFIEPAPIVSIHRSKSTPEFPPPSPPPPPPPPPQPQHSVFNTLFSKKGKTKKKVHSISTNSTPPTPPPPPKKQVKKTVSKNIAVQGDESPLRLIPTPPPPPPFKLKPWQFVMQGDYVKIESNNNSPKSGYSASEDESSSISPGTVKKSEIPKSPLFCPPSPDVNTKADDFIAMFRAKLTLEKSDSISLKHGNPGPSRFNLES